jgi:outer membrane protein OmpA-like peptidoglycan-associated protein
MRGIFRNLTIFIAVSAVSGALVSAAQAQPFRHPLPAPGPYCGRYGCPEGWRGLPVWRGPGYERHPYYGRMRQGRRQFWIDGEWRFEGWDAPPPPVAEWRSVGPWRMVRRGNETDFEMPGDVLFALDSAVLTPRAAGVIRQIASEVGKRPRATLEVDGYTDTSGDKGHNLQLSEARAHSVADALAREGVAGNRIRTRGFGETNLAVPTADGVREMQNRRVVVRLIG